MYILKTRRPHFVVASILSWGSWREQRLSFTSLGLLHINLTKSYPYGSSEHIVWKVCIQNSFCGLIPWGHGLHRFRYTLHENVSILFCLDFKKKVKARVLLCLFHMTSGLVVPMCTSCLADDANIDGMLPKRWTLDEFKHLSGFIRYTQSQILLIIIGLNNSKLFDCLKQSRKKIKRYVHLHVYWGKYDTWFFQYRIKNKVGVIIF